MPGFGIPVYVSSAQVFDIFNQEPAPIEASPL
ncbi:hypothetical protein J3R74_002052 [Puniceicoccus vermicola]